MKPKHLLLAFGLALAATANTFAQPIINAQPQAQTNVLGSTATFSVLATGTDPLFYQWQFYSADLADQTNTTLVLTNVQSANAGSYTVVVTNVDGAVTSAVATLTVLVPPHFVRQPTSQSASLGANVVFAATVSGTPPLQYQWRFNLLDLPDMTNASLVMTNLQVTNAGDYSLVVTNLAGPATSQVAHLEVDPTFTKITAGSVVSSVGNWVGCAWGDYDNDGFVDLIVSSAADLVHGIAQRNALFHNNRDGTFTRITNGTITAEARDWRGCAWADYDNDGYLDLLATSSDANGFAAQNELFRNNGDGSFTKMTSSSVGAIVSLAAGGSENGVWADYDRDGFLDAYIARFGPDWLFHNNGDGTFSQVTTNSGIPSESAESYSAMWGDYDNDGWPDLFVAVEDPNQVNQKNFLFHNNGNGTFTQILSGAIVNDNEHSIGCGWADYDNDGYLDLFVVNGKNELATNSLYHNNRDGTFTRMTSDTVGSVVGDAAFFNSCAWGDYDNDGFIDLVVTSFGTGASGGTNYLYHNNGDGTFTRVLSGSIANDPGWGIGCAWGDYDNDGFLDLFVARYATNGNVYPTTPLLYRNNGNANAWLKVRLVGTASNRSAIGAKVRVLASVRGKPMRQMRELNTGTGASGPALLAHFGLGDATNIDVLRIEWPSGIVQTMTNVAPKQSLTVVEHQEPGASSNPALTTVAASNGVVNLSATGDIGLLYVFEASTNLVNWTKVGIRSNATGVVGFTDTKATNYAHRFYRVSIP